MARILIAEDDKFLANAYRVKFTKAGDEVKMASDGKEAIAMLGDFRPDVILLDLVMPNMDGFATLKALKKNPTTQKIPVIIASNLGQKEDMEKALALGAKEFVVKSDMPLAKLIEKIHTYTRAS